MVSPVSHQVATLSIRALVPDTAPPPLDLIGLVAELAPIVEARCGLEIGTETLAVANLSRRAWAIHNARSYAALIGRLYPQGVPAGAAEVSGAMLGAVLAALSPRVLGQYVPGGGDEEPLLVLVGQNAQHLASGAGTDLATVARWVLSHELAHRAQFFARPWLLETLYASLAEVIAARPATPVDAVSSLLSWLGGDRRLGELGPLELVLPERAAASLARVSAIMSVIEGHADWVMRTLPSGTVPGDDELARVVDQRRSARGLARIVARLLGLDAKARQYERGRRFFERIEAERPGSALDVFERAESLPTLAELDAPETWLARVGAA
ncbi:conserved hypothetical protein [Acidimicrobium ferrooxidans DSM 10331]|uniref:Hydrolase n=1 Tax=Acidimicrobium ferrooxidans (strain DSM 10331 / JCM 15462 / NBRC 103882 / ICP) TaxID=525909 RepID=C7M1S3_ACIFD|nr:conserved hypothetical protein [Acidimicrobium ferrooxidans DSM 10331]